MSLLLLFRRRTLLVPAALLAIGASLAGCAGAPDATAIPPGTEDVVRVGSANFPENRLLAEIYATGLQRRQVRVERRFSVGSREAFLPALLDGSIDLVPEYTGNLLLFLDPQATAVTSDQIYPQLTAKLPESARLLNQADAQNQDAVVVTRAYADKNKLQTIDDLANKNLCPQIVFGGPAEFERRPYGIPGLDSKYDCRFSEFRPLDAGGPLTVAALRNGEVQAADMFTTEPAIVDNGFVVLRDPKLNFPAQNIVPLMTTDKANNARATQVLNQISANLDQRALTALNRRLVEPDRPQPAEVAEDWLSSVGIN